MMRRSVSLLGVFIAWKVRPDLPGVNENAGQVASDREMAEDSI
jgi:hypothetical protein